MADRLIDAQAIPLAQTIHRLAQLPKAQPDWPEQMLQEIGRLYLIIQGFHQFDQLPTTTQADLQTAVGWLPNSTENIPISDNWLVLGRQQEAAGSHTQHTTWLWGEKSQRIAQLIDLSRSAVPEGNWLPTNTVWQGALRFAPSGSPQIATRHGQLQEIDSPAITPIGFDTIRDATQAYGRSLAVNPWLADFPMLLQNVQPKPTESGWQLEDPSGTWLPLPEKFNHGWHLLALAGGNFDLTIFGVWNGRFFHPLLPCQAASGRVGSVRHIPRYPLQHRLGIFLLAKQRPHPQHVTPGSGQRTNDGQPLAGGQRQQITFVFEQHYGLLRHL